MRSVTASIESAILSTSLSTVDSTAERYERRSSIDPNDSLFGSGILQVARESNAGKAATSMASRRRVLRRVWNSAGFYSSIRRADPLVLALTSCSCLENTKMKYLMYVLSAYLMNTN